MQRSIVALLVFAATPALASDAASEARASYRIETGETPRELKVGEKGVAVIAIRPKENVHVHPQAPMKVRLSAPPALTLERVELGRRDAVDPKSDAPRFEVPFSASAKGDHEIKAALEFFICSDTWCVKQSQAIAIPLSVR